MKYNLHLNTINTMILGSEIGNAELSVVLCFSVNYLFNNR